MEIIQLYNGQWEASLDIVFSEAGSEKNQSEFYSRSQYFLNRGYDPEAIIIEHINRAEIKSVESEGIRLFLKSTCFQNERSLVEILNTEILQATQYFDFWNCKEFTWSNGKSLIGVYWGTTA